MCFVFFFTVSLQRVSCLKSSKFLFLFLIFSLALVHTLQFAPEKQENQRSHNDVVGGKRDA